MITMTAEINQDTKWYVLRVISGKEEKGKEHRDKAIKGSGWQDAIAQVPCPVGEVFRAQSGKEVHREKVLCPGYLMLEALDGKLTDEMIQVIKGVTGVIHF